MMKRTLIRLSRVVPIAAGALLFATNANAFDMHAHAEAGAAHFLGLGGAWQGREIGTGAVGSGSLELPLPYRFGVELRFVGGRFMDGQAPLDPSLRRTEHASLYGISAGLRWQPLWDDRGLWFATSFGKTQTGDLVRNVFDARVGWDFRLGGAFSGGPFVGYMQVFQPSADTMRPEDGRIALLGLHLAIDNIPGLTSAPVRPVERNDVAAAPKPAPAPAKRAAPKTEVAVAPAPVPEVAPATYDAPSTIVTESEIVISDRVHFELNSPNLTKGSRAVLESVAMTLLAHPEIELLEIDGHTDDLGTDEWNQKLSVSRASAVRAALVDLGVPASRLTVQGYGKSKPVASGADEESRQKNRRVEFVIQRRTAQ